MFIIGAATAVFLVVSIIVIAMCFRQVVPTNEVTIVQTSNSTVSYGKGMEAGNVYYSWPSWFPRIGVTSITLPVSIFGITLDNYAAYDCDRLPFRVDIKAFFQVSESNIAAERVSTTHELQEQLEAILQGAARTILASSDIESIMEGRSEYGEKFTKEVDGQLKAWGVKTVKSIELMDIRDGNDSKVIENIMAKKKSEIERDSRMTVADNRKQAQVAETQAMRDAQLATEQAAQQVGIREAEVEREVGIAKEQAQQQIQASAKETTIAEMEVIRERDERAAQIAKSVAITKAKEDKETIAISAEANKIDTTVAAEAELVQTTKLAEGNLITATKNAEGIKAEGSATAEAARLLEMASVTPQIALAEEIGENEGYQKYLIEVRQVEANETVGIENAKALSTADLKILANSIPGGVKSFTDLATPEGGASMSAGLEQFAMTDAGKAVMAKLGVDLATAKKMIG